MGRVKANNGKRDAIGSKSGHGLRLRSASDVNKPDLGPSINKENDADQLIAIKSKESKASETSGENHMKKLINDGNPTVSQQINWMTAAKVDDVDYWKQLAEKRRSALEETLKENEELQDEMDLLKAENDHLKPLADRCVNLEELLIHLGYELEK